MLLRVPQGSGTERSQALREVMQEIALANLVPRGFFGKATFYGGTCLRLFQQLPRFSEDLDFSLLQSKPHFSLQPCLRGLTEEFAALGIEVESDAQLGFETEEQLLAAALLLLREVLCRCRSVCRQDACGALPPMAASREGRRLV